MYSDLCIANTYLGGACVFFSSLRDLLALPAFNPTLTIPLAHYSTQQVTSGLCTTDSSSCELSFTLLTVATDRLTLCGAQTTLRPTLSIMASSMRRPTATDGAPARSPGRWAAKRCGGFVCASSSAMASRLCAHTGSFSSRADYGQGYGRQCGCWRLEPSCDGRTALHPTQPRVRYRHNIQDFLRVTGH